MCEHIAEKEKLIYLTDDVIALYLFNLFYLSAQKLFLTKD